METSILNSTKETLGLAESYTAFDLDVTIHINAAFSTMNQLGVGPADGFSIEDAEEKWEDLELPNNQLGLVKTYIYLKVRMLFDPPTTSYLIEATEKQIREIEFRLLVFVDDAIAAEGSS